MKLPTLTGTNFEEFDIGFTAAVRRQNAIIGISLDYLLGPDAVGNYNAPWNTSEEKLKSCASLIGQSFNNYSEKLYNLLIQCVSTSRTSSNTCLAITGQIMDTSVILN